MWRPLLHVLVACATVSNVRAPAAAAAALPGPLQLRGKGLAAAATGLDVQHKRPDKPPPEAVLQGLNHSKLRGPLLNACESAEVQFCAAAKAQGKAECTKCTQDHVAPLGKAGCHAWEFTAFCQAPPAPLPSSNGTHHHGHGADCCTGREPQVYEWLTGVSGVIMLLAIWGVKTDERKILYSVHPFVLLVISASFWAACGLEHESQERAFAVVMCVFGILGMCGCGVMGCSDDDDSNWKMGTVLSLLSVTVLIFAAWDINQVYVHDTPWLSDCVDGNGPPPHHVPNGTATFVSVDKDIAVSAGSVVLVLVAILLCRHYRKNNEQLIAAQRANRVVNHARASPIISAQPAPVLHTTQQLMWECDVDSSGENWVSYSPDINSQLVRAHDDSKQVQFRRGTQTYTVDFDERAADGTFKQINTGTGVTRVIRLRPTRGNMSPLPRTSSRERDRQELERLRLQAAEQASLQSERERLDKMQTFYHGTSIEAGLAIQAGGFRVDLSGTNAGTMLGNGVYLTTTLEKALNYAKPKPHSGCVLELKVDLGRCKELAQGDAMMRSWHQHGYDSAHSGDGVNGVREEHCVRDALRVKVWCVVLGNTGKAMAAGFVVQGEQLLQKTSS